MHKTEEEKEEAMHDRCKRGTTADEETLASLSKGCLAMSTFMSVVKELKQEGEADRVVWM